MQKFPDHFIFSTSTAAFQIEGGRLLGGRKHSNWDKFTIENYYIPPEGSAEREVNSIAVAADFYHKYEQDAKIMNHIGVNGFVYMIDWARIFPDNMDEVNEVGLDFYESVFKTLCAQGIQPIPILYHWDTPLWLEAKGGTASPLFVAAFCKLAQVVFRRLGQYATIWYVSDENNSYTIFGLLKGHMPPLKKSPTAFWKSIYYLSIAAAAAKAEFEKAKQEKYLKPESLLGIDHAWGTTIPFDQNDPDDLKACQIFNEYNLDLYLDPNILGKFPECFYQALQDLKLADLVQASDLTLLKKHTLDLIGWNYYMPVYIASPKRLQEKHQWAREPWDFITDQAYIVFPAWEKYTAWKWLIKPESLVAGAHVLAKRYQKPLMIVENGLGYFDKKTDGIVKDYYRIDFLNDHLREVQRALSEGIPFIGYSLWTYCDIYSPSGGYRKRYGLVGVDFDQPQLDRFPKASMFWYQAVIAQKSTFEPDKIPYEEYAQKAQTSLQTSKLWKS